VWGIFNISTEKNPSYTTEQLLIYKEIRGILRAQRFHNSRPPVPTSKHGCYMPRPRKSPWLSSPSDSQGPFPVAVRSKSQVCGCLIPGIEGSNPAESMDIRPLCLLCVVWVAASVTGWTLVQRSLIGCVCVWSRNLNNKAVYARDGLFGQKKMISRSTINHGSPRFYSKGPQPLLRAGSQASSGQTPVSCIPNCLNYYCDMLQDMQNLQLWPPAAGWRPTA